MLNSGQGRKYLVMGLLWQLIKMYLFKRISRKISSCLVPDIVNLLIEADVQDEPNRLSVSSNRLSVPTTEHFHALPDIISFENQNLEENEEEENQVFIEYHGEEDRNLMQNHEEDVIADVLEHEKEKEKDNSQILSEPGEDDRNMKHLKRLTSKEGAVQKLSYEQLLIRWVNYHLEKAGSAMRIRNFMDDVADSMAYIELINQIAPKGSGVHMDAMEVPDLKERAEMMLEQAEKIDCRSFVTAKDVVLGCDKLNMAFVANLFINYPALDSESELNSEADIEILDFEDSGHDSSNLVKKKQSNWTFEPPFTELKIIELLYKLVFI